MYSDQEMPTVAQSIRDATAQAMRNDDSVILFGLGVNDPGRVFGTTSGLVEEFGIERVFETPTAENAMMGVAVGAALGGRRPIITHQRADFFYLAMDQLVNSAAKWRFMFGGQFSVPLVIRLIVGRGWGQGPTHSQNLAGWLSQIPGLKVVYPSNSKNASELFLEAVRDENPIVYVEDRWLHSSRLEPVEAARARIGRPALVCEGDDVTVVTYGFMVSESYAAAQMLVGAGITVDLIDVNTFVPLSLDTILASARKTGRLLIVESEQLMSSFGSSLAERIISLLEESPLKWVRVIGLPPVPQPTSFGATAGYYPTPKTIASTIAKQFGVDISQTEGLQPTDIPHDVHSRSLEGPF